MKTSRLMALAALLSAVLAVPLAARAQEQAPPKPKPTVLRDWRVKSEGSTLTYKLKHKLHEVLGQTAPTMGAARLLSDGKLLVKVRANVADFSSGNANRDVHMKEVTEAHKFPFVEFLGEATGVKVPETFPATLPVTVVGHVTFHGVKQAVSVPMTVTFTSAKEARAEGTFHISLEAHKVARPSLLMVKVDDTLVLEPSLMLMGEGT